MKPAFIVFFAVFISIFGLINYYIGLRGWQAVGRNIPFLNARVYWVLFWLVAMSYLLGRLSPKILPDFIRNSLSLTGSYWMAAMLYITLALVFIDLIRLSDRFIGFLPKGMKGNPIFVFTIGLAVLVMVIGVLIYGTWNAGNY